MRRHGTDHLPWPYRVLLGLAPAWLRRPWGDEIAHTCRRRLADAARGGSRRLLRCHARELGSLTATVVRAHLMEPRVPNLAEDPMPRLPADESRSYKIAWAGALAVHFLLFMAVFPETGDGLPTVREQGIVVLKRVKLPPPPPPAETEPRIVRDAPPVPVPDPTPDEPEPIVGEVVYAEETEEIVPTAEFVVAPPATGPPAPQGPVRAGADVVPPSRVEYVQPDYPELAVRARLECTVILEARIGRDGSVTDTQVLRGCGLGLDEAAVSAVSAWRYTPTVVNGRPVEVLLNVTVRFELH